jgi:hypothetical protein
VGYVVRATAEGAVGEVALDKGRQALAKGLEWRDAGLDNITVTDKSGETWPLAVFELIVRGVSVDEHSPEGWVTQRDYVS